MAERSVQAPRAGARAPAHVNRRCGFAVSANAAGTSTSCRRAFPWPFPGAFDDGLFSRSCQPWNRFHARKRFLCTL